MKKKYEKKLEFEGLTKVCESHKNKKYVEILYKDEKGRRIIKKVKYKDLNKF